MDLQGKLPEGTEKGAECRVGAGRSAAYGVGVGGAAASQDHCPQIRAQ